MGNRFLSPGLSGLVALLLIFGLSEISHLTAQVPLSVTNSVIILKLKNGDRITGNLISETTNAVIISNSWAKELALPLNDIASREVVSVPESEIAKAPVEAKPQQVITPSPPVKQRPKIAQLKSWTGKVDLGADLGFSEKTWQLYYARAKVIYAPKTAPGQVKTVSDRFKNTFDFQATYGRTDGVLSANRMDGSSKTDFEIGKKVFVYNLVGGGYDEIRRISLQYEIGPGLGYHLITRSNFVMNTEAGMNYQVQRLEQNVGPDETNKRFSLRLAQDATWSLSQKLTFDEKIEFYPNLEELGEFRLRFESNLRYSLWQSGSGQNIYLALTLLDIYETQPAGGVDKNDLQIRSSIGIAF